MASQAHELARILIETHPENTKARIVYADVLYTDNKFQEAKEQYLIVLENEKSKSQIWTQVLFIQAEQSDFKGMLKTSKESLEYFPLEPLFYYFHGISNKWFKKYKEALISFETGVDFVVDNSNLLLEFYSSLADIYQILNIVDIKNDYSRRLDGRSKTLLNSYKRISRSFGFDYTKNHKNLVDKLCKKIMRIHVDKLYASLEKIIKKNSTENKESFSLVCDIVYFGSQITKNMINRYNLKNIDMDKILQCYPVKYNSSTLTHFPSFAVAALLRDKYE